jgi:hypothetical protein
VPTHKLRIKLSVVNMAPDSSMFKFQDETRL